MANFQFRDPNPKFLLTNLIFEGLQLLTKIPRCWFNDCKIENLPLISLLIYKKIFIWGLPDHFLEGSLTKKQKAQKIFLVRDPFKKCLGTPEIENFPLMHLRIHKKYFISSQF